MTGKAKLGILALIVLVLAGGKGMELGKPSLQASQFKILVNTYSEEMDGFIVAEVYPFLQDGDIVAVVHGNGANPLDLPILRERLNTLRRAMAGKRIFYAVLTAGKANTAAIAAGLREEEVAAIFCDYEENFGNIPEFSREFAATLANLREAAGAARAKGFRAGAAPSGRGLFDNGYKPYGWDYGLMARELDVMLVQTQSPLKRDEKNADLAVPNFKKYLGKLARQLTDAATEIEVYAQITISDTDRNGVALEYGLQARRAVYEQGFKGMSLWFANSPVSKRDVAAFLKDLQAFRSDEP